MRASLFAVRYHCYKNERSRARVSEGIPCNGMIHTIAFFNQKGDTAKPTSTLNVAAERGRRVQKGFPATV